MTAFYFSSSNEQALLSMLIAMQGNVPTMAYQNVLGPLPAVPPSPAVPAVMDGNGNVITPAIPASAGAGVAGQFYLSINLPDATTFPAELPSGVVEDDVNGQAVLGVWA